MWLLLRINIGLDFVLCLSDMESAFRALEKNNYGFTVHVGRNIKKQNPLMGQHLKDNDNVASVPPRTTGIDYQNRTYRVSKNQQPRPSIDQSPVISEEIYKGLPMDVINNDAHSLEREGLYVTQQNDKFMYKTGRSYIVLVLSQNSFVINLI